MGSRRDAGNLRYLLIFLLAFFIDSEMSIHRNKKRKSREFSPYHLSCGLFFASSLCHIFSHLFFSIFFSLRSFFSCPSLRLLCFRLRHVRLKTLKMKNFFQLSTVTKQRKKHSSGPQANGFSSYKASAFAHAGTLKRTQPRANGFSCCLSL